MATKKFSKTQRITKGNLDKVPGDKPGVYRIKNAGGDILYIGKAKGGRLDDRIAEHKGRFQGGTQFQYRTTASKEAAERLEQREIKEHIPPRNKKK
jgi:excinuclease UvrABC nuclease subunit